MRVVTTADGTTHTTPLFLPVFERDNGFVTADDLQNVFGVRGLITNGFFIYKERDLRTRVAEEGVKSFLGFDGLVMTDSGAFQQFTRQLYLSNKKIIAFQQEIGAIIFDVTSLPEVSEISEVARIQDPDAQGGFLNLFAYKHSSGRTLLFATGGQDALIYDLEKVLGGDSEDALLGRIATPEQLQRGQTGYHDFFVAFHADTQQDRFYGAGAGGYHLFDLTNPMAPEHLTSISSAAVHRGHTIAPTPDGRYMVTAAEYRTSPIRIFDMQPVFDGDVSVIRTAIGAWTANWEGFSQQMELRWPYLFVGSLEDGLHIVNMRDPEGPYTTGYYKTWEGPMPGLNDPLHGAWGVDVRNTDGLVVVSDLDSGLWVFRLEAFEGWDGRGWGVPDISSVQDWEHGPVGK